LIIYHATSGSRCGSAGADGAGAASQTLVDRNLRLGRELEAAAAGLEADRKALEIDRERMDTVRAVSRGRAAFLAIFDSLHIRKRARAAGWQVAAFLREQTREGRGTSEGRCSLAEEERLEEEIARFVYGQLPIEKEAEVIPKLMTMLYLEHEVMMMMMMMVYYCLSKRTPLLNTHTFTLLESELNTLSAALATSKPHLAGTDP
jgi:hypothetical protein